MKSTIFYTVAFVAKFFNGNVKIYIVGQLLRYRQCGKISQPQGAPGKCVGQSLKNLGPSQKTLRPTWGPKLVTG